DPRRRGPRPRVCPHRRRGLQIRFLRRVRCGGPGRPGPRAPSLRRAPGPAPPGPGGPPAPRAACARMGVDPSVRITAEPGRSIVAAAAITLYTVGTVKRLPGIRTYVSVDGRMSDNPR